MPVPPARRGAEATGPFDQRAHARIRRHSTIACGVPHQISRPPSMTPMRSASASASAMSCVTRITHFATRAWMRRNSCCSWRRVIGSSAPNGSSISSTGDRRRARARRRPLPLPAGQFVRPAVRIVSGARPISSSSSRTRAAMRSSGHRSSRGTTAMLSATVQMRKEADLLNHVANRSAKADRIPFARVSVLDAHVAGVRQEQPIDQFEDGRLARAARADQRDVSPAPTVSEKSSRMGARPAMP